MKKHFLLVFLFVFLVKVGGALAVVDYQCLPSSGVNAYVGSYGGATVYIDGVYQSEAAAQAAAAAYVGPAGTPPLPTCTTFQSGYAYNATMINSAWGEKGRWERYNHSSFGCGPQDGTKVIRVFIYPYSNPLSMCPALAPDTDGDGIRDDIDPYPSDTTPLKFKIVAYQTSTDASNGTKTWIRIQMEDGSFYEYGTKSTTKNDWYTLSPVWQGNDDFSDLVTGLTAKPNADTVGIGPGTDPAIVAGNDATGNVTEIDHLTDVVNNTKKALDNQASQQTLLKEIRDNIIEQTKVIGTGTGGVGPIGSGGGGGVDQAGVAGGVGTALDDRTTAAGDFSGISGEYNGSLGTGDVPQKGSITDTLQTAEGFGGSVKQYFLGSRVVGAGACSFTWTYKGKSAQFGVCEWGDQLALMGTILLGLAGAYSLMIVLGRA